MKFVKLIFLVLISCVLFGCGLSNEEIGETTKTSMQQTFDADAQFKERGLRVSEIAVLKKSENQYQGMAKLIFRGETHDVPVDITVDGKDVMWQVAPGSFGFIAQKELQKLQEAFQQ